jgi:branched-chain amino acid transport system ATP-binding protein
VTALEVRGLVVAYGAIRAVDGVDLHVDEGECVTILGANGAGKSSTLNSLAGLVRPAAGTVELEGEPIGGLPAHQVARRRLTLVPEGRQIFSALTVRENLLLGGFCRPQGELETALAQVVEIFPALSPRMGALAGTLSGGEQQMLALGRALMAAPRVLMLDEPSLGLAPLVADQIFAVIQDIAASGIAVLLVEQNVHRALQVAARGYVLELGHVVLEGSAAQLLGDEHVRMAYLGHGLGEDE